METVTRVVQQLFMVLRSSSTYKYLIPGAFVTLVYASFLWGSGISELTEEGNPESLSWSSKLVYWLSSSALWFSTLLFEFLVITLFSPFMAALSEHVDTSTTGRAYSFSFSRFLRDLARTLGILITGFIFSSLVMLIWNLFAWIGDFKVITPYIIFIIKAFFIGFNYVDYSLERDGIAVRKSWQYALRRWIFMLLIGGVFSLLFSVPILGVLLAPFAATILATTVYIEVEKPNL